MSLVIDLGSHTTRYGLASQKAPTIIPTRISKYTNRQTKHTIYTQQEHQPNGYDRSWTKNPYDGPILHPEIAEHLFDHIFENVKSLKRLVLTEPPANPAYTRAHTSELLFELYQVPEVTYAIDALLAAKKNKFETGIIVSSGHNSTHVLPYHRKKLHSIKRIEIGGNTTTEYLLKLLQTKYPAFPIHADTSYAESMMHDHCYVPVDYAEELQKFVDIDSFKTLDRMVQIPFIEPIVVEKSVEEYAEQERRKQENAERLRQMAADKRMEKLAQREARLAELEGIKNMKDSSSKTEYREMLKASDFKSEDEIDAEISQLQSAINTIRARMSGIELQPEVKEAPVCIYLQMKDEELDDEQRKAKRREKLMMAGWEARERIRIEKEAVRIAQEERQAKEDKIRKQDPVAWLNKQNDTRNTLIERYKEKLKMKDQLSDRRSVASQIRMKTIADLAADTTVTSTGKKKRKLMKREVEPEDDDFGRNDDDWAVYGEITTEEVEEEDELIALEAIDTVLMEHDPTFVSFKDILSKKPSPMESYLIRSRYGMEGFPEANDLARSYQMHMNVERIRVPECIFQPFQCGVDSMGIVEMIDYLTTERYLGAPDLAQNILLTGAHMSFPGLEERVKFDITALLPPSTPVTVRKSGNVALDAWFGGTILAQDTGNIWITKADYEEYGAEYYKEHECSNARQY